jgi:23S rRNA (uracil1939-C5)-methyltransferase
VSISPATSVPERVTLRIDSLAHGGDGVARLDSRVVFVPRVAPGDLVIAELTPGSRRELRARAVEVLEAGPGRVEAPCPHYERCGGCQWQHLDAPTQLTAKVDTLREAIARIGRIPRDQIPSIEARSSPSQWHYRRRARLHVGQDGRLGYVGRDGREIVEISSCAILTEPLLSMVLSLGAALEGWQFRKHLRAVEICEAEGRGAVLFEMESSHGNPSRSVASLLSRVPTLSGAVIQDDHQEVEVGTVTLSDGEAFIRPDVFAQGNRGASEELVDTALMGLCASSTDSALELYCGDGNFTLPLANRAKHVVAVDREGKSLSLLRRRAERAGKENVVILAGDVERVLPRLLRDGSRFDVALLDPPRTGAKAIMAILAPLVRRRLCYVSCDPATLARDIGSLHALGYRLERLTVADLFPQTYHLEAVAILEPPRSNR